MAYVSTVDFDAPKNRIDPVTLRFRDERTELEFQEEWSRSTKGTSLFLLIAGLAMYGAFLLLDTLGHHGHASSLILQGGIVLLCITAGMVSLRLFPNSRFAKTWLYLALGLLVTLAPMIEMVSAGEAGHEFHVLHLLVILTFVLNFNRAQFFWSASYGVIAVSALLIAVHFIDPFTRARPTEAMVISMAAVAIALIGLFLVYSRELSIRRNYLAVRIRHESERRFRAFSEAAADLCWESGPDHRFTNVLINEAFKGDVAWGEIVGRKPHEVEGFGTATGGWEEHFATIAARKPFRNVRFQRVGPDGTTRHISVSGKPIFNDDGEFGGYVGVVNDITDQVRAEQEARATAEQLATSMDAISTTVSLWDRDDRLVFGNRRFRDLNAMALQDLGEHPTFGEVLDAVAAQGLIGDAAKDPEGWAERRLSDHRRNGGSIEQYYAPEDRWFLTREEVLPDGGVLIISTDTTHLHRAQELLAQSENRLSDFAAVSADWFWETDTDHRFVYVDGKKLRDLGAGPRSFVGRTRLEVLIPDDNAPAAAMAAHQAVLDAREPFDDFRYWRDMENGQRRCFSVSGRPIFNEDGRFNGYRGIGRDITEAMEAEDRLRTERQAAESANRAKSDFLANVSHELRTPLNAVVGFSDLIVQAPEQEISGRLRRYAEDVHASGAHLLELINDLLDISKIEAGKMTLRRERISLQSEVERLLELVAPQFEARGIWLEPWFNRPASRVVAFLDRRMFRQIMLNLLSNAGKFGRPSGKVTVEVRHNDANLEIRVIDDGPGIAPENLERVFARFEQVREPGADENVSGTGIGLPLSRELTQLHGGSLHLESEQGIGTIAVLKLPDCLSEAIEEVVDAVSDGAELRGNFGARVLVAEDHPVNRTLMKEILDSLGCRVVLAENGEVALKAFRRETFDLVFMDIQMPVINGIEATRWIRHDEEENGRKPVRIIALSAHALVDDNLRSIAAGMDDHLAKPVRRSDIQKALERWFSGGKTQPAAVAAPVMDDAQSAAPGLVDETLIAELVDISGPQKLSRMVDHMSSEFETVIETVRQAVGAADWELARAELHRTKGGFASLGATVFPKAAARFEKLADAGEGAQLASELPDFAELGRETLSRISALCSGDRTAA